MSWTREGSEGEGDNSSLDKPSRAARVSPLRPAVTRRPLDDRYRVGSRRTAAQPLAAAWRPEVSGVDQADEAAQRRQPPRGGRPGRPNKPAAGRRGVVGFASTYGWRVYALPVLVVVTALVVFNVTRTPSQGQVLGQDGLAVAATTGPPMATEGIVHPIDPKAGTAVLPPGDSFTQAGIGAWQGIAGDGQKVGTGPTVYHYGIAVEQGIDPASYGGNDAFAKAVESILSDPRSWVGSGSISLQRVGVDYPSPDFIVSLTTPNTDHRPDMCGFQIQYEASCWNPHYGRVVINLARWVRGALAFNGDIGLYRQYAINHEVGHVFNNQHVGCASDGGLAPVMMQQTFGVSDDYVWQLNQSDDTNSTKVARDGKTCRPNAWPFPQGVPGGQTATQSPSN